MTSSMLCLCEELQQEVVVKAEVRKGSGIGQAQLSHLLYKWTGVRIMTSEDHFHALGCTLHSLALNFGRFFPSNAHVHGRRG